jgi:hypothetical protein
MLIFAYLPIHYTISCHLLHVSAVFGHHQVDCSTHTEKNIEMAVSTTQVTGSLNVPSEFTKCKK